MSKKPYLCNADATRVVTPDDVFAMYENGQPVNLIVRKLSRLFGLTLSECREFVHASIVARLNALPPVTFCSSPPAGGVSDFSSATVHSPFHASWAVGDLCTRRY